MAEGVGETGIQQLGKLFPFLVGKARAAPVGAGIFQVDLLVRNVHIAADDHRLFGVQLQQKLPECIIPGHAVIQTGQLALGVGRIDRHQIKLLKLTGDDSAFVVMLGDVHTIFHRKRRHLCKNSRAGIALFHSAVPILLIALQLQCQLIGLHFCLLQTNSVCTDLVKKV